MLSSSGGGFFFSLLCLWVEGLHNLLSYKINPSLCLTATRSPSSSIQGRLTSWCVLDVPGSPTQKVFHQRIWGENASEKAMLLSPLSPKAIWILYLDLA